MWCDDIEKVNNAQLVAEGYIKGKGIPIKRVVAELAKSFEMTPKDAKFLQKILIEGQLKGKPFVDLLVLYTDAVDASRKQTNELNGWDADVAVEAIKELMICIAMRGE